MTPRARKAGKAVKVAPCQARAVPSSGRCKRHGGLSTGPRTTVGRSAIEASNRRRKAERMIESKGD